MSGLLRPCIVCGKLSTTARCGAHRKTGETWAEIKARRRIVDDWIATHGYLCPGWDRDPHPSHDLTVDHIIPQSRSPSSMHPALISKARGPADIPVRVLCRSCNARRGAGTR